MGHASVVTSGITATLRVGQIVFDLIAVKQQARDLLASTNHISTTLQTVRTLRRQKSELISTEEKKWVDYVLEDTEESLAGVTALVEPVRVDMEIGKFGGVSLANRAIFTFRDSPKVATNVALLSIRQQSLNTALSVLSLEEARPKTSISRGLEPSGYLEKKPPTYE